MECNGNHHQLPTANKRNNNFTQGSSYSYGYENGYEDGYNSHSCECDNYHESYDSGNYLDSYCDYDYQF